jgi:hypothetical protein
MVVTFHQLKQQTMETKMNKIVLTLVALATLSTASFAAGNRNWDLRDTPSITGRFDVVEPAGSVEAFAVPNTGAGSGISAYERTLINQENNESSSHSR